MTKDGTPLPPSRELATMKGDAATGEKVFRNANTANCIKCHQSVTKAASSARR